MGISGTGALASARLRILRFSRLPEDRLCVHILRDGTLIDVVLDCNSLKLIDEKPGNDMAGKINSMVAVPTGLEMRTVADLWSEDGSLFLAWPTMPPNHDRPYSFIREPTTLMLVEAGRE